MKNTLFFLLVLFSLSACEETITLDIDQVQTKYVIDAILTNENKNHVVKITQSADFYNTKQTPRVSGATVQITDNTGKVYEFAEKEAGMYHSKEIFGGEVGKTYTLKVQIKGQEFTATERLLPVSTVEKLAWRKSTRPRFNQQNEDSTRKYEVLLAYAKEPKDRTDFYLFKFVRNGKVENNDGRFVAFSDDANIVEDIKDLPFPVLYAMNDTASLEMYSISKVAFVYFNDLQNTLNNDGGMFSPIPANIRTNISNGALGFFQVSSVSKKTIVVGQ